MVYTLSPAAVEARRKANLRHGAQSTVHLAPLVLSMKKSLLARMGVRQRDLDWAARETLDTYVRAKSKVLAVDSWLEEGHAMIDAHGNAAGCMRLYFVALNASTRSLEALRSLIAEQAREDDRFGKALAALAEEGARVRASHE